MCLFQGSLLVGTKDSEIIMINEKSGQGQSLVQGHSEGELWGLSVHSSMPRYATASDDGTVRVWDLAGRVRHVYCFLNNQCVTSYNRIGKLKCVV